VSIFCCDGKSEVPARQPGLQTYLRLASVQELGSPLLLIAAFLILLLLRLSPLLLTGLAALVTSLAMLSGLTALLLAGLSTLSLLTVFLHIVCHEAFLPWVRIAAHSTI